MRWEIIRSQKNTKDGIYQSRKIGEVADAKTREEATMRYKLAAGLSDGGKHVEYFAKCIVGKERMVS